MDTPDQCIDDMTLALYDLRIRAREAELALLRPRVGTAGFSPSMDGVAVVAVLCDHVRAAHEACVALLDAVQAGVDTAVQRHVVRRAVRQLDRMCASSTYSGWVPGAATAWRVRCADLLALLYPDEGAAPGLPEQHFFADPA